MEALLEGDLARLDLGLVDVDFDRWMLADDNVIFGCPRNDDDKGHARQHR
jgi:hypothetical protein